jgi:cytochrome c553
MREVVRSISKIGTLAFAAIALSACAPSETTAPYTPAPGTPSAAGGAHATVPGMSMQPAAKPPTAMQPVAMQPVAAGSLPCEVSQALARCSSCHGATPSNGAPMPLVTLADLTAPAKSDPTRKVHELVALRVQDRARPMPPDPTQRLTDPMIAQLQAWSAGGAKPGAACTSMSGAAGSAAVSGGQAGGPGLPAAGGGAVMPPTGAALAPPNDADIEKCYELRAHGQAMPGDKTKYMVPGGGETYSGFIFKAPWTTPVQGLRFRHLADNAAVLHHWLLYSESASSADGSIETCELSGPTGFLCGQASTRALITGWAPGRKDFSLPGDVGLELPGPGQLLAVEFHYFNTGAAAQDQSGVEVCVTSKFRKNTASVSWLGTQQINVAAHAKGDAGGTCTPLRKGMNATDPIHVLYSWPHMHKLGRHLKSVVNRAGGMKETMYDGDFSFDFQVLHDSALLLMPGDSVTTTCTFDNTTDGTVSFGQSTTQEMCYNFTYAWPAHALDNPGAELGGATNACLH